MLKVALVGHFNSNLDEGVRNVSKYLAGALKNSDVQVEQIDINSLFLFKKIFLFKPDILHFILSPTIRGLIISKMISSIYITPKYVLSAIHPNIPQKKWLSIFKPDLCFTQSHESDYLFKSLGFKTFFLPNGVDLLKFIPCSSRSLRNHLGIPNEKYVIIHMASITKQRNLEIFNKLQQEKNIQVVIIGRENEQYDESVFKKLKQNGCLIIQKHFEDIKTVYCMADCYLFPSIHKSACIETPLSVLEAMACNLPVITTKFGCLPRMFNSVQGLFFVNNEEEIINKVHCLMTSHFEIKTRDAVVPYSWERLSRLIVSNYIKLLNS